MNNTDMLGASELLGIWKRMGLYSPDVSAGDSARQTWLEERSVAPQPSTDCKTH